jgi:23S rRNA pseudouridine1911/1915/1917 synthase
MDPPDLETFVVPQALDGARLDVALARLARGWSRTRLQSLVRAGGVRVDGEPVARPVTPVRAGARIEVQFPAAEPATTPAGAPITRFDVLYEDEHLVVIDKPAGLVVHPSAPFQRGTLTELARERFGDLPEVQGEDRPGIVHRLDRLTSGVMVLGRTREALLHLKQQFERRAVDKTYLAIVHGDPRFDSEWIERPMAPSPRNPKRSRVVPEGTGREASTYIETRERFRGFALLACKPETGRTHQIRVHLASAGLPVAGDPVYGGGRRVSRELGLDRQGLHATRLGFEHPVRGGTLCFESELPRDLADVIAGLST